MRSLFALLYLANVALAVGSIAFLPDRVAIHFGWRGLPDNWASKEANAMLLVGVDTVLFALLSLVPWLVRRLPVRWVNLPHREYWLHEDRRAETLARLAARLSGIGAALFGLMLWATALTVYANLSDPVRLDLPLFLGGLGAFLAYTVWWCAGYLRAFRLPPGSGPGHRPE